MIDEETMPELKVAYQKMLDGCLAHPKGIDDGLVEIGYGIYPEYEGQGFMTEAVTAVVKWAANQPCVNRIEAEAEEDNFASIRVLKKAGFIPTGKIGKKGTRFVFSC